MNASAKRRIFKICVVLTSLGLFAASIKSALTGSLEQALLLSTLSAALLFGFAVRRYLRHRRT